MSPQDPQTAALVAHVVSQIESNVQFLAEQNYISHADASAILTKLPNANTATSPNAVSQLANRVKSLALPARTPSALRSVPAAPSVRARAIWSYNENGVDPDDLSFSAGDIIEIVEETNADWWKGRFNGKEALFPANYVEKISTPAPAFPVVPAAGKPAYKPFRAAYAGMDQPPPAPTPAAAPANSLGLQQVDQTEKKSKYGALGNTMAHSAAGGVGFGAGAAIGGGLVRAIF
ncbi:SH3 domain-containing protein [Cyathus striatus]|nr:SH3 domain-containing protein [Cyathus striatus]